MRGRAACRGNQQQQQQQPRRHRASQPDTIPSWQECDDNNVILTMATGKAHTHKDGHDKVSRDIDHKTTAKNRHGGCDRLDATAAARTDSAQQSWPHKCAHTQHTGTQCREAITITITNAYLVDWYDHETSTAIAFGHDSHELDRKEGRKEPNGNY